MIDDVVGNSMSVPPADDVEKREHPWQSNIMSEPLAHPVREPAAQMREDAAQVREDAARTDPVAFAQKTFEVWWNANGAIITDEVELDEALDSLLTAYVAEFGRLARVERATNLRAIAKTRTWRAMEKELGRKESTLRGQAAQE